MCRSLFFLTSVVIFNVLLWAFPNQLLGSHGKALESSAEASSIRIQKPNPYKSWRKSSVCETVRSHHHNTSYSLCALKAWMGSYWLISEDESHLTMLLKLEVLGRPHGEKASFMTSRVTALKVSPDHETLAVEMYGEGHTWIELIHLQTLLYNVSVFAQKESVTVSFIGGRDIDPYPGHVSLIGWKGSKLQVTSNMLLTHRYRRGSRRVNRNLNLGNKVKAHFLLDPDTEEIVALEKKFQNPVRYFGARLLDCLKDTQCDGIDSILGALHTLESQEALPYLQNALKIKRKDQKWYAKIQQLRKALQSPSLRLKQKFLACCASQDMKCAGAAMQKIVSLGKIKKEMTTEDLIAFLGEPTVSTGIWMPRGTSFGYGNKKFNMEESDRFYWFHFNHSDWGKDRSNAPPLVIMGNCRRNRGVNFLIL